MKVRGIPFAIAAYSFVCFFPYPALAIGGDTGLQLSYLAAMACLAVSLTPANRRPIGCYAALVATPVVAGLGNILIGDTVDGTVLVKAIVILGLALIVMLPAGRFALAGGLRPLMIGACWAIVVHFLVGFYQLIRFKSGQFPLLSLYRNPAFADLGEIAEAYALYVRRPFGLFPEPSAMAASIGPWIVLAAGLLLRRDPRLAPRTRDRRLLWAAAALGSLLVIISRSGYVVPLGLSLALLLLASPGRLAPRLAMMTAIVAGAALLNLWLSSGSVLTRIHGAGGSPWGGRSESMVLAITSLGRDIPTLIFGYGSGQSTLALLDRRVPGAPSIVTAIWSALLRYVMENGLLGALALGWVLFWVVGRGIASSSARLLGWCIFLAWLAGATVTTSYMQLSAVWTMLALLVVWPSLFPRPSRAVPAGIPTAARTVADRSVAGRGSRA